MDIENANSILLRAQNIRKSFNGRCVVEVNSLVVHRGSCNWIIGSNGSGKTTLLKIIAGLLRADSSEPPVQWHFNNGTTLQQGKGGIMLAHQTPYMFACSVRDNISFGRDKSATESALAWAGLSSVADFPAKQLSGGMQQRVSLARLHAASPQLCLLDEPFAHLDAEGMALLESFVDMMRERNAAIIIAAPQKNSIIGSDNEWILDNGVLSC